MSISSYVFGRRALRCCLTLTLILLAFGSLAAQDEPAVADTVIAAAEEDSVAAMYTPASPANVQAVDKDDDQGGSLAITWSPSPDDTEGGRVKRYLVHRAEVIDGQPGEYTEVGDATAGATTFDDGSTTDGIFYSYRVSAVNSFYNEAAQLQEFFGQSDPSEPTTSSAQWFNGQTINTLVGTVILSFFILFFIHKAKSGKKLFIRKIGGMEAVDEAVGRATEMGKKIFFISGIGDMDNMQTIAAITILGRVAQRAAEYETYLDVPTCRSMVMVTAREVVKEAYSKAGRPDVYKDDQVHYLTDDQFGYAAAVDGMVVREKPATIFLMGQFFAESLILAETGNSIGAIQIAGTAMPSQLPFFVAACDYTLIGEELFAASAYLSKEPKLLGSLKGQDAGKAIILAAILVGVLLETFGVWQLSSLFRVVG